MSGNDPLQYERVVFLLVVFLYDELCCKVVVVVFYWASCKNKGSEIYMKQK